MSHSAGNQVDVSMIDRLPCRIAKVRTDVGARHFGVIAFYAAM
jgi:hypothetical protein